MLKRQKAQNRLEVKKKELELMKTEAGARFRKEEGTRRGREGASAKRYAKRKGGGGLR